MVLADERIVSPEWANEEVDIWKFLFEDRHIPGEASAALCKVKETVNNWRVPLFPEDRNAIRRAGYSIAQDQSKQQVVPVILTGGDARRIAVVVGLDGTHYPVNVRDTSAIAAPAAEPPKVMQMPHSMSESAPVLYGGDGTGGAGIARLWAKISQVMGNVSNVVERGQHGQGYTYATDGDMFAAVRGEMSAANLAMLPPRMVRKYTGDDKGEYIDIEFMMADGDTGEILVTPWIAKLQNNTDKAIPAAITMALKYYLKYTFLISTEGDHDADRDNSPGQSRPRQQRSAPSRPAAKTNPPASDPEPQKPAGNDAPSEILTRLMNDSNIKAAWKSPAEARNTINKMWREGALKAGMDEADIALSVVERLKAHGKDGAK